ncbi:hypothetical protein ACJMK2_001370, partial [Sinanodonta woodiana]
MEDPEPFVHEELPYYVRDIVFLQIRENKLGLKYPSMNYVNYVERFLRMVVRNVLIGAFLPQSRPKLMSVGQYNQR